MQIFVCETPGIWGSLPKGYDHLWSGIVEAYLTLNVQDPLTAGFIFKKGTIKFYCVDSTEYTSYIRLTLYNAIYTNYGRNYRYL